MLSDRPALFSYRLALRNMRTRRWRTLLTLLGIVLGVAVVLAILVTNGTTLDSLRQVFDRAAGKANLLVTSAYTGSTVDEQLKVDVLPIIEKTPHVQVAAPSLAVQTMLARDVGSYQFNYTLSGNSAGINLSLVGIDPELDPQVRVYNLVEGRMPVADRYETVIPQKYSQDKGLKVGNDLVFIATQGEARLKIVGILSDEGSALLNDGGVAFAPLHVVQDLFERGSYVDEIGVNVDTSTSDNPRLLEAVKNDLARRLGKAGEVAYPGSRGQLVPQMLSTYQQGLAFFSIIALFVGAFLIYNTFSMTIVERTREIGMLRAIGMNRRQIIRLVLAEALILALVGSALGIAAGLILARGLIRLMGAVVNSDGSGLIIPPAALAQALFVGLGVTLGAALIPAIQASLISPLEALRVQSRSSNRVNPLMSVIGLALILTGWLSIYKVPWRLDVLFVTGSISILGILLGATLTVPLITTLLERISRPLALAIYGNEGALGSANVHRSIARTTLTVAALMVALTMVIGIGSLAYSVEHDISRWIDTALGGDLYLRAAMPLQESFGQQLASMPGVAAVTPARYIGIRVAPGHLPAGASGGDALTFYAIDPQSYRQVASMEFSPGQGDEKANWNRLAAGKAIFISNGTAEKYHLYQGDQLVLQTRRGEQAFYIAAEVVDFSSTGNLVVGTYDDMHRWFSQQDVDRFTVKVQPGYSVDQVSQEIEARYKSTRQITVVTTELFKNNVRDLVNNSFRLFDVLNLIGIIIGALGVVNTLTMNVLERQREIGGLRSLGMSKSQILRMVLAESLAMGVTGGVYGLAFGYIIAQILILGMNMLNAYQMNYIFTPNPFLVGMLIALVVSQLAALYPARGAARVNIVEAIKHE